MDKLTSISQSLEVSIEKFEDNEITLEEFLERLKELSDTLYVHIDSKDPKGS